MRYTDSYEIEFKPPGGEWESVGHVYPHYIWKIVRPWYFLGLVCRPRIVNDAGLEALLAHRTAVLAATQFCLAGPKTDYRIWRWERRGWKLRRALEDNWERAA